MSFLPKFFARHRSTKVAKIEEIAESDYFASMAKYDQLARNGRQIAVRRKSGKILMIIGYDPRVCEIGQTDTEPSEDQFVPLPDGARIVDNWNDNVE